MSYPGQPTSYDRRLFSVVGIPVSVSPTFFFLVLLSVSRSQTLTSALVHVVAVTVSVLVHELGHGLAAKEFGLRPSIMLHGLGGYCRHGSANRRSDELVVVASGPGAGLLLGALAWSLQGAAFRTGQPWLAQLVYEIAWIGLFWSLINLLPVLPLDGGTILRNRLEGRPGTDFPVRTTWLVSRATAVIVVLVALWFGETFVAVLFGLLGWRAHQQIGRLPKLSNLLKFRRPAPKPPKRPPTKGLGGQRDGTWH